MDFTLLQFLSGAIADRLNLTPTELLSAINTLSALPVHPYDQAKYELFGPEHTFKTFQEIEIPENFNITTIKQKLSSHSQKYYNTVQTTLSAYNDNFEDVAAHKETNILNQEIAKKNIVFSEAIRTLTLNEINADPEGVAKRVISFYLNL
jgi:hypothetical protein